MLGDGDVLVSALLRKGQALPKVTPRVGFATRLKLAAPAVVTPPPRVGLWMVALPA